jgi:hypothetical protein
VSSDAVNDSLIALARFDATTANPARMYDYWLGGKDNFEPDRAAAEEVLRLLPDARDAAHQNRAFLRRVVRYLVRDCGIRQIIDVGSGLPTRGNVHEIAAEYAEGVRTVYVDNDVLVGGHARALLESPAEGVTFLDADLRVPAGILLGAAERGGIDLDHSRVAVLILAAMHFVPDKWKPADLCAEFMAAAAPGSYLALSHGTDDAVPVKTSAEATLVYARSSAEFKPRSSAEIRAMFGGLELVDPGLADITEWRPDPDTIGSDRVLLYGGVGRKP